MEEKILIKSEQYDIGKACKRIFVVVLLALLAFCAFTFFEGFMNEVRYGHPVSEGIKTGLLYVSFNVLGIIGVPLGAAVVLYIVHYILSKEELVVSDKRIYGRVAFGHRVDLPMDSVSAVGMSIFKSIAVGTSSGKIYFNGVKNRDEIHSVISDLIIQRQKKSEVLETQQNAPESIPKELKKYKELLDDGVITQEDYDAKKKQLLGL